jgi:AbiV family abortive infection protein
MADEVKPLRRASTKAIAANVTAEKAFHFGYAAYENAARLLQAAVLTAKGENYGVARSLAILAREELGKYLAAILFAAGRFPPSQFADIISGGHKQKQVLGVVLSCFGVLLKPIQDKITAAMSASGTTLIEAFKTGMTGLQAQLEQLEPSKEAISVIERGVTSAHVGNDEARRTEGLYVDFVERDGELVIRSPALVVSQNMAKEEIAKAKEYFEMMAVFNSAISFDVASADNAPVGEVISAFKEFLDRNVPRDDGQAPDVPGPK